MIKIERQFYSRENLKLSYLKCGIEGRPLIILLHGFPEDAHMWDEYMVKLASLGYFVLAPDILGFGQSDSQTSVNDYAPEKLNTDLYSLMQKYNYEKVIFIGHDWGSAIGWSFGNEYKKNIKKLVLISAPHLDAFQRNLKTNPIQILKSWYMFLIQIPILSEFLIGFNQGWILKKAMKIGSSGKIKNERVEDLNKLWLEKGRLSSMLRIYRFIPKLAFLNLNYPITVPTLVIGGENDPFIAQSLFKKSVGYCQDGELFILPHVRHFPHYEDSSKLLKKIISFIKE